jgi:DNA transformation protein
MSSFVEHLHSVFADFGTITTRRMFGGYGVYHDGLMFALVVDDVLYLKVDERNQHRFDAESLEPFEFTQRGRVVQTSYRRASDALFDDSEVAAEWAREAFEAALRAKR